MTLLARTANGLTYATPGAEGSCPHCGHRMHPKCGPLVTWHWAHAPQAECDPWSEPESEWHRRWKLHLQRHHGARIEVTLGDHRADAILPNGDIWEFQHGYLPAEAIHAREAHYAAHGRLRWIYDAGRWIDRIHHGRRGFWWKHGAKSMAEHRTPVWWDTGDEMWLVSTSVVERTDPVGQRVLGRILTTRQRPALDAP